ncbi:MAG TPA: cupin domain-containing protein [Devosiaceae bacterium]
MADEPSASEVIERLALERHPEGGWYRQTMADPAPDGGRALSTAIYYLLEAGDCSHWHRVDATEVWHWYAGAPLELSISSDGQAIVRHLLGADVANQQLPQAVVPRGQWQSARSHGEWTLCGCTVAPGFEFSGFELAPDGWTPRAH